MLMTHFVISAYCFQIFYFETGFIVWGEFIFFEWKKSRKYYFLIY